MSMVPEDQIDFRGMEDPGVGEGLQVGESGVEVVAPAWISGHVRAVSLQERRTGKLDIGHYGRHDVVVAVQALGVKGIG
jgi:hypothetical protein